MLNIKLEDVIASELFEILQELINRAKEDGDTVVISYVAPVLVKYGAAYIDAKPGPIRKNKLLRKQFLKRYKG